MSEIVKTVASWMHAILPEFVRLPSLTFALPHFLYWSGLLFFPLVALYLVKRESRGHPSRRISPPIAWLLWLFGGFVGLHRFYLKAARGGVVFVLLFIGILYGNQQGAAVRNTESLARNDLLILEFDIERFQAAVDKGTEGAAEKLEAAEAGLGAARERLAATGADFVLWRTFSGGLGLVIVILLLADAVRMGALVRRCEILEENAPPIAPASAVADQADKGPRDMIRTPVTDAIDRINGYVGNFICYWSIIAVFAYYFEVLARYVFNSPTNWVHEGMFLMFGMQYLLAGGYAFREDAHVRVDVIYDRFSERTKAIIDVVSSLFFFIFAIALLWTGLIFASDSVDVWEVSFTEWAIQYWPVKATIALGGLLILAQGAAKLIKDLAYLFGARA